MAGVTVARLELRHHGAQALDLGPLPEVEAPPQHVGLVAGQAVELADHVPALLIRRRSPGGVPGLRRMS